MRPIILRALVGETKSVVVVGPYLRAREQFVRAWVYDTLQMCGIIDITKR